MFSIFWDVLHVVFGSRTIRESDSNTIKVVKGGLNLWSILWNLTFFAPLNNDAITRKAKGRALFSSLFWPVSCVWPINMETIKVGKKWTTPWAHCVAQLELEIHWIFYIHTIRFSSKQFSSNWSLSDEGCWRRFLFKCVPASFKSEKSYSTALSFQLCVKLWRFSYRCLYDGVMGRW